MNFPHHPGANADGKGPTNPDATQETGLGSGAFLQYTRNLSRIPAWQMSYSHEHGQRDKEHRQQKGKGDKADRVGTDRKDIEAGKAAIPKFPRHYNLPRESFACPFAKYDPARYGSCLGLRLRRISDITQHISRVHVLMDDVPESRPDITPDKICVYCTWCRQQFHGQGAEGRLHDHTPDCKASERPATIEETGVLVPKEFDDLKSGLRRASGSAAKWEVIWQKCFPATPPPPPYFEIATHRIEVQRILQQLLNSPAANPWSTADIRQSWIDKALAAIYSGLPFTESEPQINDASTTVLTSGESILDDPNNGSSTAPESCVDLGDMQEWTLPLKTAILDVDHDRVHDILRNSFDKVAVGEYSWLLELKSLGLSMDEIADELLERAQQGPWIYSEIDKPCVEDFQHDFHITRCLHSWKKDQTMPIVSRQPSQALTIYEAESDNSVRETIEYLCGIGGVRPMPDGSHDLQFGSVVFENANSTAIASLKNSEPSHAFEYVFQNLKNAIGGLQEVGGCCDSFSFLAKRESFVELERIYAISIFEPLDTLISLSNSEASMEGLNQQLLDSLSTQFVSLAFALYAQGHCEPFRPFFLDTPLNRILLIGNQIWGSSFTGPCILATPVDLSCLGEMVQRRVFAFQYFDSFERSRVFSDCDTKFDLKACPEDLLDTWGPGDFIMPKDDAENLHAISIGGGLITSVSTETESHELPVLHWSPISENNKVTSTFPRHEKMVIGSRVSINQDCKMIPQEQFRKSIPWLKDLGTFPSYWEVSERQLGLGLQGGQSAVGILNFAQTWVKRLGQTKKSNILAKRSLSIADLEGPSAVQISFCTGIARRVRLRELLADVLPAYVEDLATKPRYWEKLQDCDILEILRREDFRTHYQRLDRELQAEFEKLAIAVLFLLQDTGVDRKGEKFVVGCIPQGVAVQCFEIPIEKESFWARILADSEDVATFAYVATRCFETNLVKCRGPKEQWMNTAALLSTAVSLCQDRMEGIVAQHQTRWTLKDSEAYLIGRVDAPLLVRVLRPNIQDEPELLVSMSTIIAPFLRRWSRKQGYKRPWLLRESRAIDHQHQMAESVVVTVDFQGS